MSEFFSTLQAKDWITLTVSACAFIVSVLSYYQKAGESRLALRKQLTDLFEKLTAINTEFAMYRAKKDEYPAGYPGLLGDQRRFLVRQAAFIATKIRHLVSPFEYLLLAGGHDDINDWSQAERYFELAISTSSDPIDRGIAIRGYGRYLYNHGRLDEARKKFSEAVKSFEGTSDRFRVFRADTFERWSDHEREWIETFEADRLLQQALMEYEQLDNPARKAHEVDRLRAKVSTGKRSHEAVKEPEVSE